MARWTEPSLQSLLVTPNQGQVADWETSPCLQKVTFLEGGPGILAVKTAILSTLGEGGSALAAQQVTVLLHLAASYCLPQHVTMSQLVTRMCLQSGRPLLPHRLPRT